ncbi:hypothetical protein EYF80_047013 [Liparis tanakae]|uniref:Uncharacterized protein n=1 Tax=Liparis tanakae TaxID=230148 RepID=A0A4Z2FPU7_9TELE|nr:hypothetical protein EYF80_047013 [Liparis tanakae]
MRTRSGGPGLNVGSAPPQKASRGSSGVLSHTRKKRRSDRADTSEILFDYPQSPSGPEGNPSVSSACIRNLFFAPLQECRGYPREQKLMKRKH